MSDMLYILSHAIEEMAVYVYDTLGKVQDSKHWFSSNKLNNDFVHCHISWSDVG